VTPALIPVTGADQTAFGQPMTLGLIETGIILLGLGALLNGVWLKFSGR
jgi:hypothetical protein